MIDCNIDNMKDLVAIKASRRLPGEINISINQLNHNINRLYYYNTKATNKRQNKVSRKKCVCARITAVTMNTTSGSFAYFSWFLFFVECIPSTCAFVFTKIFILYNH